MTFTCFRAFFLFWSCHLTSAAGASLSEEKITTIHVLEVPEMA